MTTAEQCRETQQPHSLVTVTDGINGGALEAHYRGRADNGVDFVRHLGHGQVMEGVSNVYPGD